jgi:hypothetical protein
MGGSPGLIVVHPDGTFVSGGVIHGSWKSLGPGAARYELEFPDDAAHGQLSADSRTLVNLENPNDSLSRVSGGDALPGLWRFQSGLMLTIEAGGVARMAGMTGRWSATDEASRVYEFLWPGARPIISVSGDAMQYVDPRQGATLSLKRVGC